MNDKLMINDSVYDVEYIENELDNITIRFECPEFCATNYSMQRGKKYNYIEISFDCYKDDTKIIQSFNSFIEDVNAKRIRKYERTKIYVFTSKENIKKIKQNRVEYNKAVGDRYGVNTIYGGLIVGSDEEWEDYIQ